MTKLANLPTMDETAAARRGPIRKGPSRLETKMEERPLVLIDERAFRTAVRERDRHHCRCCGRRVRYTLTLCPERGEIHHIHGKRGDLRFEERAALLLCCQCHQRVTGRVNDRLLIVATKTFRLSGEEYTDARAIVHFESM